MRLISFLKLRPQKHKLMARMERLPARKCENCQQITCQNGKNVNINSIVPGAKALVSFDSLNSKYDLMLKRLGNIFGASGAGLVAVFCSVQSIKYMCSYSAPQ